MYYKRSHSRCSIPKPSIHKMKFIPYAVAFAFVSLSLMGTGSLVAAQNFSDVPGAKDVKGCVEVCCGLITQGIQPKGAAGGKQGFVFDLNSSTGTDSLVVIKWSLFLISPFPRILDIPNCGRCNTVNCRTLDELTKPSVGGTKFPQTATSSTAGANKCAGFTLGIYACCTGYVSSTFFRMSFLCYDMIYSQVYVYRTRNTGILPPTVPVTDLQAFDPTNYNCAYVILHFLFPNERACNGGDRGTRLGRAVYDMYVSNHC